MTTVDGALLRALEARRRLNATSSRRTQLTAAPVRPPLGISVRYARELTALLAPIEQIVNRIIVPRLPSLVLVAPLPRSDARFDAGPAETLIAQLLGELVVAFQRAQLPERGGQLAFDFGQEVAAQNTDGFQRQVRTLFGVDLPASNTNVGAQLDLYRTQNVSLITNVVDETKRRVEQVLIQGARSGVRVEDLAQQLQAAVGFSESRARLIARDQVLKLNGELTELRQREVGVEEYIWDTSDDERVRPDHALLDGTTQRWDSPPIVDRRTGRRAHPGGDYSCRCTARPVINLERLRSA